MINLTKKTNITPPKTTPQPKGIQVITNFFSVIHKKDKWWFFFGSSKFGPFSKDILLI